MSSIARYAGSSKSLFGRAYGLVGARGFEPPTCRRGDRSTGVYLVRLALVPFCNNALSQGLRCVCEKVRCALMSMVSRVLSPSIGENYVGAADQRDPHMRPHNVGRSFHSSGHSSKTSV